MTTSSSDTAFRLRQRRRPVAVHPLRVGPPAPRPTKVTFCVRGVVSPILANIYLHEVLDEWFMRQVAPRLVGRAHLIRYADDAVIIFSQEREAQRVLEVLPKRLAKYSLTLHPGKTRLVDFRRPDKRAEASPGMELSRFGGRCWAAVISLF